ncbi:MAG: YebC/PmpR family DNA-binding transcriptional regulator, partial [Dehalococcoidia bacterium]
MSGHSKWKSIKHQKGAADAKRGQLFTRLARELTLAARQGAGADPDTNYQLRLAIDRAKSNNMPTDTIDRAIKRGSGEGGDQEQLEEILYEGYGPGGAAIMLQAVTSNRNRTASDVRSTFSKSGASLGEAGCVAWNFEPKGIIALELDPQRTEEVALLAIDVGADDVKIDNGYVEIHTPLEGLEQVKKELEKKMP